MDLSTLALEAVCLTIESTKIKSGPKLQPLIAMLLATKEVYSPIEESGRTSEDTYFYFKGIKSILEECVNKALIEVEEEMQGGFSIKKYKLTNTGIALSKSKRSDWKKGLKLIKAIADLKQDEAIASCFVGVVMMPNLQFTAFHHLTWPESIDFQKLPNEIINKGSETLSRLIEFKNVTVE